MVRAFATLLVFQWLGEVLARLFDLPVPGPVLGMAALLATLLFRSRRKEELPESLDQVSAGLLSHLSLLFVPAGVGVLVHVEAIREAALPLGAVVLLGTPVALAGTALIGRWAGAQEPR